MPDLDDIEAKITDRTRAIVVINPNNPTGAVYPRPDARGADRRARPAARPGRLSPTRSTTRSCTTTPPTRRPPRSRPTCCTLTFNGLSKAYRVAGLPGRLAGGVRAEAARRELHRGPDHPGEHAAVRRTCPSQHAIQTALGGHQSINDLVLPGGRLLRPARRGLRGAERDPRRHLREAEGRAVRVPAARPGGLPDQGRRADRARPAAAGEDPGRARAPASTGPTPTTSAS